MTEIVQNNNSMKFDLLETGNSSSSGPDSDNLFNNLLGSVNIENTDQRQDDKMSVDEDLLTEQNIHEILSVLSEGNLKLDEDIIGKECAKADEKHLFGCCSEWATTDFQAEVDAIRISRGSEVMGTYDHCNNETKMNNDFDSEPIVNATRPSIKYFSIYQTLWRMMN